MTATHDPNGKLEGTVDTGAAEITKTILLIDDTDSSRIATKWFLGSFGYAVETAVSAEQALLMFNPRTHDLVITDNAMPGMTGAEMAHIIKLRSPATPVLMYSGNPPPDNTGLDPLLHRSNHLLQLKEGIDKLLANPQ